MVGTWGLEPQTSTVSKSLTSFFSDLQETDGSLSGWKFAQAALKLCRDLYRVDSYPTAPVFSGPSTRNRPWRRWFDCSANVARLVNQVGSISVLWVTCVLVALSARNPAKGSRGRPCSGRSSQPAMNGLDPRLTPNQQARRFLRLLNSIVVATSLARNPERLSAAAGRHRC